MDYQQCENRHKYQNNFEEYVCTWNTWYSTDTKKAEFHRNWSSVIHPCICYQHRKSTWIPIKSTLFHYHVCKHVQYTHSGHSNSQLQSFSMVH